MSDELKTIISLYWRFPFSGYTGDIKSVLKKAIDAMAIVERLGLWDELKNTPPTMCGECKYFCNAGDFDLCCAINERRLCYANDDACEKGERDND